MPKSILWQPSYEGLLARDEPDLAIYKTILVEALATTNVLFQSGTPSKDLILARSQLMDKLLGILWKTFFAEDRSISLLAAGGYGREELHPFSDIDLLILLPQKETTRQQENLSSLINFLWDTGLQVGHAVRTIDECVVQARADISVFTNILESRFLLGNENSHPNLLKALVDNQVWPSDKFYQGKLEEQRARHERFNDTEYTLEPNLKQGPGGLRDLHTIIWITRRQFGSVKLKELFEHDFLTKSEYEELTTAKENLWDVRMALHLSSGRAEERILFDYQPQLAKLLGFAGQNTNEGVEHFMHSYYLSIRSLSFLNELLLQLFSETYFVGAHTTVTINQSFMTIDGMLTTIDSEQFKKHPADLLQLFVVLAKNPQISGVRARTIRDIRANLNLLDEDFRQNTKHNDLFISLFASEGLTHTLRRMHRYGVLGAYLPDFAKVTGRMQYDLFHTLTVDEHILFVIRHLRRLCVPQFSHELPQLSKLIKNLERPELLHLAALFHDIAKGQVGDHSKLGQKIAYEFCIRHGIDEESSALVSWLVENHLLMSVTAQRKDIDDIEVIEEFISHIKNQTYLQMLYLLTVADIRATNPELWNDWKASLLQRLYHKVSLALSSKQSADSKQEVLEILSKVVKPKAVLLWQTLGDEYFARFLPEEIAWQTQLMIDGNAPIVKLAQRGAKGASVLFVYAKDQDFMFAKLVSSLEKFPVRILEANIYTAPNSFVIDTFQLLDKQQQQITDDLLSSIPQQVATILADDNFSLQAGATYLSRHEKHFKFESKIKFQPTKFGTQLEVITSCRSNLLTMIAFVLTANQIKVHSAKIATFGARAEDIFVISNADNNRLDEEQQKKIKNKLQKVLD